MYYTKKTVNSIEQTFHAWENLWSEIWHEFHDAASADVPVLVIDIIRNLIVILKIGELSNNLGQGYLNTN